jgi:hypothetical protein
MLHEVLPKEELEALAPVEFEVNYKICRGGRAAVTSRQKKTIIRATWKAVAVQEALRTEAGRRAHNWLMENNTTYKGFVEKHNRFLEQRAAAENPLPLWIPTEKLLLKMPGLEIAARPWLYPLAAFGDTDLSNRLKELNQIATSSTPSVKTGWFRKVCSRSVDYWADYALQCFLYDVSLARSLTSVVSLAEGKKMAPEVFAADMAAFEMYWHRQTQLLEDVCRQAGRLPELFFTLAPAEWKFPLHEGVLPAEHDEELSSMQLLLTMHLYNALQAVLRRLIFENGDALEACGIEEVEHWCMRFEFQKRGTIHVHVICWYKPLRGCHPEELTGRSGERSTSPLLRLLEEIFRCSVDVQGGRCRHNLLTYVLGYVAKASDALQFRTKDGKCTGQGQQAESRWRQVYRLLSKRSPLEQEMAMDMAGQSMVRSSFTSAFVHAPIPGSEAVNRDRHLYNAFQQWLEGKTQLWVPKAKQENEAQPKEEENDPEEIDSDQEEPPLDDAKQAEPTPDLVPERTSFLEWCRKYDIKSKIPHPDPTEVEMHGRQKQLYTLRRRNEVGRGQGKLCSVAVQFPFELLDIYIGSYVATFYRGQKEEDIWPDKDGIPENMAHMAACLQPYQYEQEDRARWKRNVETLMNEIADELLLRGLGFNRMENFRHRFLACADVLRQVILGHEDPSLWSARNLFQAPVRTWSQQQQQVLDAIQEGLNVTDANDLDVSQRVLQVTGGPGTGKTEVVIAAALAASEKGFRVLVGAPVGLLVSMYRQGVSRFCRIRLADVALPSALGA